MGQYGKKDIKQERNEKQDNEEKQGEKVIFQALTNLVNFAPKC